MKRVYLVLGTILVLAVAALEWDRYLRRERFQRYGPAPGIGISWVEAGNPSCQEVVAVQPVTHYNWLGRIWQEEHLLWEDVQVQHPPPREFPHGKSGPVRVGDVICGFGEVSDIRYVHRPTGATLTETCESYRCPLE